MEVKQTSLSSMNVLENSKFIRDVENNSDVSLGFGLSSSFEIYQEKTTKCEIIDKGF